MTKPASDELIAKLEDPNSVENLLPQEWHVAALIARIRQQDAEIERMREAFNKSLKVMRSCEHDGGFDQEIGPIGCMLGDGCVCSVVYPLISAPMKGDAA